MISPSVEHRVLHLVDVVCSGLDTMGPLTSSGLARAVLILIVATLWNVLGLQPVTTPWAAMRARIGSGRTVGSACNSMLVSSKSTVRSRKEIMRRRMVDIGTYSDAISNAFIGGTVGVMGAMVSLEVKKTTTDLNLDQCPYCIGNGQLLCATCFGGCVIAGTNEACPTCGGTGLIECIGCKGDGRNVPLMLISKAQRNPEYAPDEISLDKP